MKTFNSLFCVLVLLSTSAVHAADKSSDEGWSAPTNGLRARIVLHQQPRPDRPLKLVPYLELQNVDDVMGQLKVSCDTKHCIFELVDGEGKPVHDGESGDRSGPYANPGTIGLPIDSSIRINMDCYCWGLSKDAAATVATDSAAWWLKAQQRGKVFLRVTLKGMKDVRTDDASRMWQGQIQVQTKVDWKD